MVSVCDGPAYNMYLIASCQDRRVEGTVVLSLMEICLEYNEWIYKFGNLALPAAT